MSNEFQPLIEVLREFKALMEQRVSGVVFIVTEELHSGIVRLYQGQVKEMTFRMLRNDEAVQGLSMVVTAKLRFQASDAPSYGNKVALSEKSLAWLLGGFEQQLGGSAAAGGAHTAPAGSSPSPAIAAGSVTVDKRLRHVVEQVALSYLGPIAAMLCDEAFATLNNPQQVVAQLATFLNSPQEARRFIDEAHKALNAVR